VRPAVLRTTRSVIAGCGQSINALDRFCLLRRIPTLVVWGTRDRMIPVHHAPAPRGAHNDAEIVPLDGSGICRAGPEPSS
jgi:pimeloyl-ACP methyl ester carboxylesterase